MSKVVSPSFPQPRQSPFSSDGPLSATVVEVIKQLVAGLNEEDRAKLLLELSRPQDGPTQRGGSELLGAIIRLLPKQKELTVENVRRHVHEQGIEAKPKAVYNAIGYLARKGYVKNAGYGRYIVDGMYFEATEEFGPQGCPSRTDDSFCLPREEKR